MDNNLACTAVHTRSLHWSGHPSHNNTKSRTTPQQAKCDLRQNTSKYRDNLAIPTYISQALNDMNHLQSTKLSVEHLFGNNFVEQRY